jgi:uncharacterized protein
MTLIVSDASPLHYLALIGEVPILPSLYDHVIIPEKVFSELQQPTTPNIVKTIVSSRPSWIEVRAITTPIDASLFHLDRGEQEAITLAIEIQAGALLIDETEGRRSAKLHGLKVVGTLGVLYDAAIGGLCKLDEVFDKLKQTNFRATDDLYQQFINAYEKRGK